MPNDPEPVNRDELLTHPIESDRLFSERPTIVAQVPAEPKADDQTETVSRGNTTESTDRPVPDIPGYEILGEIGRGGVAVVYKARQTKLDRVVALKVLLSGALAGDQDLARFRAEAQTVAQLKHPNVIEVYDVGEHNGVAYIAVEYASGGDLHKWLGGKPLPVTAAMRLVYTLARAVGAAHQKRVVHRDLKPANILLTENGIPKVADFGLAKQYDDAGHTASGAILGTPYYMAPEQAAGLVKRIGPPADVYALGVILYECLTGRVPFTGDTVLETLDRVRFAQPIPVQDVRADIPRDLAEIVRRCLNKIPEERYASADALADAIARVNVKEVIPEEAPLSMPTWVVPVIGMVAAIILAGLILRDGSLFNSKPDTPPPVEKRGEDGGARLPIP